jgi:hypothetical protein
MISQSYYPHHMAPAVVAIGTSIASRHRYSKKGRLATFRRPLPSSPRCPSKGEARFAATIGCRLVQFPSELYDALAGYPRDGDARIRGYAFAPAAALCDDSPFANNLSATSFICRPEPDVEFLFLLCGAPVRDLAVADYEDAARVLEVEVAAIQAVAEVETVGAAFDDAGRPTILFERHIFHRETGGRYSRRHPDLSNPVPGGYGRYSEQYLRLERAFRLDASAALKSASWGRFQIMGFNHARAGFATVQRFVKAMTASEREHLLAFVAFVKSDPKALVAIRDKDWAEFAARYNGKSYRKNDYDTKLEVAYKKFLRSAPGAGLPKSSR